MDQLKSILSKITYLFDIGIFLYSQNELRSLSDDLDGNPLQKSSELIRILMDKAKVQEIPAIYRDCFGICFCCIKREDEFFLIGPFCIEKLNIMELHRFYQYYDIDIPYQTKLPKFTFSKMIYLVELLAELITRKRYDEEELIYRNQFFHMVKKNQQQEQFLLEEKEEEEEQYHHTYQEEEKVLNSIREGRVDDAVRYSKYMDEYLGKMSNNKLNQWRNAAIVSITLATRAAIQGGVSPAIAYRLSDYYIGKCDPCVNIVMLMEFRNHAIEELTERVRIRQKDYSGSSYTEKCKDYIRKHYHEKIYLKDIAEESGLSFTYLSRLFRRETGIRIQDYIIQFRVERAANLLLYSEKSIAAISEYVNLTSQSYFSAVFKKYKGMTPKKYRDRYKPVEVIGKK